MEEQAAAKKRLDREEAEEEDEREDQEGDDQEEDMYFPGLTQASLFQKLPPLPRIDGLVPKELADQIQQEYISHHHHLLNNLSSISANELIQSSAWRSLANFAFLKITRADPSHTKTILEFWGYRFRALYELQLPKLILREMVALFSTMSKTMPLSQVLINLTDGGGENTTDEPGFGSRPTSSVPTIKAIPDLVPFYILVLRARLPVLLTSHHAGTKPYPGSGVHYHRIDAVVKTSNGLFELLEGCQRMIRYYAKTGFSTKKKLWRSRLEEVVRLLSQVFSGAGGREYAGSQDPRHHVGHVGEGGGVVLGFTPDLPVALELLERLKALRMAREAGGRKQVGGWEVQEPGTIEGEVVERQVDVVTEGKISVGGGGLRLGGSVGKGEEEKKEIVQKTQEEEEEEEEEEVSQREAGGIVTIGGEDDNLEGRETEETEEKEDKGRRQIEVITTSTPDHWVAAEEIRLRFQLGDRHCQTLDAALAGLWPEQEQEHAHLRLLRLVAGRQFDAAVRRFLPVVQARIPRLRSLQDLCLVNDLCIASLYSGQLTQALETMKQLFEHITQESTLARLSSMLNDDLKKTCLQEGEAGGGSSNTNTAGSRTELEASRHESRESHPLPAAAGARGGPELLLLPPKRGLALPDGGCGPAPSLSLSRLLNSLVFNYATLLELCMGSDADPCKLALLAQLLRNPSHGGPASGVGTGSYRLGLLDLVSLHSLKLPLSYTRGLV